MKILTFNVRGIGEDKKILSMGDVIRDLKPDFIAIQETMLSDESRINVQKIWGRGRVEFDWVNAEGRSGGLLCCWDPSVFQIVGIVRQRNFLFVSIFLA